MLRRALHQGSRGVSRLEEEGQLSGLRVINLTNGHVAPGFVFHCVCVFVGITSFVSIWLNSLWGDVLCGLDVAIMDGWHLIDDDWCYSFYIYIYIALQSSWILSPREDQVRWHWFVACIITKLRRHRDMQVPHLVEVTYCNYLST